MYGNSTRENRETPLVPVAEVAAGRLEKAVSRKSSMYAGGESDGCVVPSKSPNKGGQAPAEGMEGRQPTKENIGQATAPRTQSRISELSDLLGVRKAARKDKRTRFAQQVVKSKMEPAVDPLFHPDSYGYRPGKSALDAVGQARQRCWRYDWIVDLDIKGFFDNIPQDLLIRAVKKHAKEPWMVLYIQRWLKAPVQEEDGQLVPREKGTPQGGVISPLLANLFLHYAFDRWMATQYRQVPFERFADDAIVHCRTEQQAQEVRAAIAARLKDCGLELHPEKTKVVYCKDEDRRRRYPNEKFDFLVLRCFTWVAVSNRVCLR